MTWRMVVISLTTFFLSCFMAVRCCAQQLPTYEVAQGHNTN